MHSEYLLKDPTLFCGVWKRETSRVTQIFDMRKSSSSGRVPLLRMGNTGDRDGSREIGKLNFNGSTNRKI